MDKPEGIRLLEREKEKAIAAEIENAVRKAKSLKSDFLGFGRCLYRAYPKVWREVMKDWNEFWFPRAEVAVKVNCHLLRTGSTADTVKVR